MAELTTRERFARMFTHQEADRVPIIDDIWPSTLRRWHAEGMPEDVDPAVYFGIDRVIGLGVDASLRRPKKVLEETESYRIATNEWGATIKSFKDRHSSMEMLEPGIRDFDDWPRLKKEITPDRDRVPWKRVERNWAEWRKQGWWIWAQPLFGFDISHARFTGTEEMLMALVECPDIVHDMFEHQLDVSLQLLDMMWEAGYHFDCIRWPDDMGYKQTQFFSLKVYREVLKPLQARAIEWAHAKGIPAHLHSCGDINPFVPELVEIGLDGLNPLEVKAGMDPVHLKKTYGEALLLHGGINAVLWDRPDEIRAEIERVLPIMKESGGYIFSSDHSVPDSVGLEDFRAIVELARKVGRYA